MPQAPMYHVYCQAMGSLMSSSGKVGLTSLSALAPELLETAKKLWAEPGSPLLSTDDALSGLQF